jgi:hypothetical protein
VVLTTTTAIVCSASLVRGKEGESGLLIKVIIMGVLSESAKGDCKLGCYNGDEIRSLLGFCPGAYMSNPD